jgi:glutathione peroxidase
MNNIYSFTVKTQTGQSVSLAEYSLAEYTGKVVLIVNTASQCGFTPQYEGLQALYERYQPQGLEVLAFPCNQFGQQEPGDDASIASFCATRYAVSFPVFAKLDVNGEHAHPLFTYLKTSLPGVLGSQGIKWNFTKFLVDRAGVPRQRYGSLLTPANLAKDIEHLLKG